MKQFFVLLLAIWFGGLVACANPTAVPTVAPTPVAPRKTGTVRFSLSGVPGVKEVPWLMSLDTLRAQGYTVTLTEPFSDTSLIPIALMQNEIEVGSANANTMWTAISKGANIRTIAARTNSVSYFVSRKEIQSCQGLNNLSLAFSQARGTARTLFDRYVKLNCPNIAPKFVSIVDIRSRLVALSKGEVDGATIELEDWIELQKLAPDKFRILIDYSKAFPDLQTSTFTARRDWAQQNPEMVKDFIRALLNAFRRVQDPTILKEAMIKYISFDNTTAGQVAETYVAAGTWDVNGGISAESIQATLAFLMESGSVSKELTPEMVADLSYLNAVLNEIGRK